jgi:predicted transcriptional regulator
MDYKDIKNLINVDDIPKYKYWRYSLTLLVSVNLIISITSLGNILYGYQYFHDHDYSGIIKNISKIIKKACEEINC